MTKKYSVLRLLWIYFLGENICEYILPLLPSPCFIFFFHLVLLATSYVLLWNGASSVRVVYFIRYLYIWMLLKATIIYRWLDLVKWYKIVMVIYMEF